METSSIPNAAPQALRTGKPRSFWMIIGLSVITCGIYYIVYKFMVASELKKATFWGEDESFKPSTFMILFGAYVVLSYVLPMVFGIAVSMKVFISMLSNSGNFDPSNFALQNTYQLGLSIFTIMASAVGYYVAYYFFKLNDIAAAKVGAKPLSIRPVFIAYSIFFAVMLLNSLMEIAVVVLDLNTKMANSMNDIENLSLSTLGPILMVVVMGLGMSFLMLVSLLYFLWKQTELVNHVWEAGYFTTPLNNFAYNTQPSGPISYPATPTIPQQTQPLQPPPTQAPPAPPSGPVEPEQNDLPKAPPENPVS